MKEVFAMWKYTKMVVLVALSAAIYAALLIPFKALVLIPGFTEIRPASAFPVVLGLLFGPDGAWGSAFGNLIGDFFGTLSIGSIFGFMGNFFFAYVPYKLWSKLGLVDAMDDDSLMLNNTKKLINFIMLAILSAMSCALIIAWGCEVLRLVPFAALATIIWMNNLVPSIALGIPLLLVLYPRIKKWDLLWTDIMEVEHLEKQSLLAKTGALLMIAGIVGGWVIGLTAALGLSGQAVFAGGFAQGQMGNTGVALFAGIGVALSVIGGLMQK
ncbi:MAG TPA: QueT transporter family protein [Ruminiclostridium sp.]|nr:QueT transporter family protein [Ruminiclostridium sp.]